MTWWEIVLASCGIGAAVAHALFLIGRRRRRRAEAERVAAFMGLMAGLMALAAIAEHPEAVGMTVEGVASSVERILEQVRGR